MMDINCAFGPGLDSQPTSFASLYPRFDAKELVGELTRSDISRAVIAPPAWLGGSFIDPAYETANEAVHEAVRAEPDRLIGVARISPALGSRSVAIARRCLEKFRFRGLLLDAETDRFPASDITGLAPYLDLCREHRAPLLLVTGIHPIQPMIFVPLARTYSDVPVILLRMGSYVPDDAVIAAGLADNIYLETSTQPPAEVHRAIKAIGGQRVLFGSGFPYAVMTVERDKIRNLPGLDAAARDAILGGNAKRLFS